MNQNVQIDLNEVIDAFEMITMTNDDFSKSFVNRHTGRIVTLFQGEDFSDVKRKISKAIGFQNIMLRFQRKTG